jgi:hypothetical protein
VAAKRKTGGSSGDDQTEILRAIWNELKALKATFDRRIEALGIDLGSRIDQTNERLDQTNERLEAVRIELRAEDDALRRRTVESEVRLSTAVATLAGDMRDLGALIRDWRDEHRREIAALKRRR